MKAPFPVSLCPWCFILPITLPRLPCHSWDKMQSQSISTSYGVGCLSGLSCAIQKQACSTWPKKKKEQLVCIWDFWHLAFFLGGFPTPEAVPVFCGWQCKLFRHPQPSKSLNIPSSQGCCSSTGRRRDWLQIQFLFQTRKHEIKEIFLVPAVPWEHYRAPSASTYFQRKHCQNIILKHGNKRVFLSE